MEAPLDAGVAVSAEVAADEPRFVVVVDHDGISDLTERTQRAEVVDEGTTQGGERPPAEVSRPVLSVNRASIGGPHQRWVREFADECHIPLEVQIVLKCPVFLAYLGLVVPGHDLRLHLARGLRHDERHPVADERLSVIFSALRIKAWNRLSSLNRS
ncbi:MAG: hypothetical protein ACK5MT_01490 [Actinomycetales bacterium]